MRISLKCLMAKCKTAASPLLKCTGDNLALVFINSFPPSFAYVSVNRVSIGSDNGLSPIRSHCLNQCWIIINWTLRNKLQWNFNQNTKFCIHENASENIVCEMAAILSRGRWVNSLRPNDAIWQHRSGSTLAQVMACCLTTPSHYLNQCWLIISKV